MSFPKYPKYKDSGVEWLGEVPEHWEVKPLKSIASHNDEVLDEKTDSDFELLYVDISSVDCIEGIREKTPMRFSAAPSRARRKVRHGDVIVSTVRTYLRTIARICEPEDNLVVSTGFAVVRPREDVIPDYLGYTLSASYFIEQVIARSTGVSYPAINANELVRIPLGLPPLHEQTAIADFLDRETAKIDELVAEQRRLMELLKEKRQAVISHAVTKGLNPDAPMKPSGTEWLGDVPTHWEVGALRYFGTFRTGSTPDRTVEGYWNGGIPWVKTGEINYTTITATEETISKEGMEASAVSLAPPGTLLMALYGQGVTRGRVALLGVHATFNQACVAIQPDRRLDVAFLKAFFTFAYPFIREGGNETTQMNLSAEFIRRIRIPIPPRDEQQKIASFLRNATSQIEDLIVEAQRAIDLLQERRSALISAAVTGQIDVRNAVSPEANLITA